MGRKILVIPPTAIVQDFIIQAIAAGAPEIARGVPPALKGMVQEASLPVVYEEPSIVVAPERTTVAVNQVVVITATLSPSITAAPAVFQVEGGAAYEEPVTGGQASHSYAFASPGIYKITVSSVHHGQTAVEVVAQ